MFASLVLLMAAAKKKEKKPIQTGASSGHITNLKQSIQETFDIYDDTIMYKTDTGANISCSLDRQYGRVLSLSFLDVYVEVLMKK